MNQNVNLKVRLEQKWTHINDSVIQNIWTLYFLVIFQEGSLVPTP